MACALPEASARLADREGEMGLNIEKTGASCGAIATGVDLTQALSDDLVAEIRAAWVENKVLAFPDQPMSDVDLERFTVYFGAFGEDPFFGHIEGHENIAAIQRNADETTPIFAEGFHSDWSFLDVPPAIIHKDFAQTTGRQVCEKLKDLIPRHNFMIPVQAAIGGKIIARETIKGFKKDVLTKIHGGGATDRKRKLLEKQKKGKARSKQFGRVEIPQEAFIGVLKIKGTK